MSVTVGQLTQAAKLFAIDLTSSGVPDLSNLSQDAVLGEDVLAIVAVFWPPAALIEYALAIAVALVPIAVALGVHGDPDPIHDAQTTESRGGRNQ